MRGLYLQVNGMWPAGIVLAMPRILIADSYPVVRTGLQHVLGRDIKEIVWGEAENAQQTLLRLQQQAWDLLILDLGMPGRSGLDLLSDIKALQSGLPVLILSAYPEELYGKRALRAGASGYVGKDSSAAELVKAAQKLLSGGRYISPSLAECLVMSVTGEHNGPPHNILSDRELEVMRLIGVGKTVSQIAGVLNLSVTTVSTYRTHILEKMGLATTAEIMHYALTSGLVPYTSR
jgi:two-component system, NarL family, invasion response regulator UvrY